MNGNGFPSSVTETVKFKVGGRSLTVTACPWPNRLQRKRKKGGKGTKKEGDKGVKVKKVRKKKKKREKETKYFERKAKSSNQYAICCVQMHILT